MTHRTELWVERSDLRSTKVVRNETPPLNPGQVLVAIDKFALTANNVSYALSGDMIGYWGFFPAAGPWGKVPAWGCADVIESRCPELPAGERLWGFFPMASHAVLQPGKVRADQFIDVSAHRRELPGLYNLYRRTLAEPEAIQQFENERCLLFPLFATSFFLYDYLQYRELFGASQVLIGSASSKTGFGLAKLLHDDPALTVRVIGFTSPGNREFVERLDCCDRVLLYGDEAQLDATVPSAYVDMSGDSRLTAALHKHLGDNMKASIMVGATHWEQQGRPEGLPGAQPEFFFAPGHIATREQEWGPGVPMAKAMKASVTIAAGVRDLMTVDWLRGADALQSAWLDMLDNKLGGNHGLMVSLLNEEDGNA